MMKCSRCGGEIFSKNTYPAGDNGVAKRRECVKCGCSYTTVEIVITEEPKRFEGAGSVYQRLRERCPAVQAAVREILAHKPTPPVPTVRS